jgi:hypothetical protein
MEALHKMEIVWPGAGRALELLRECKVNLEEAELGRLSNGPDRNKRPAEQTLDDIFDHHPLSDTTYTNLQSQNYGSTDYGGNDVFTVQHGSANLPSWSTDPSNPFSFAGTLSTSVLPQMYSTGLGSGRGPSMMQSQFQPTVEQTDGSGLRRLPQFWNDYTGFPPLHSGVPISTNETQQGATHVNQEGYLAEQYSMYGELLSFKYLVTTV